MDDEKLIGPLYLSEQNKRELEKMREAADFARRNGGEIWTFDNRCAEKIFNEDYLQQPVLDGPLPKFCIAHHCTKRNKACYKCAYTAMSSEERRKLEA